MNVLKRIMTYSMIEQDDEDKFNDLHDHKVSQIIAYKALKTREGPKLPHPWEL
jgi:hypothetical protein